METNITALKVIDSTNASLFVIEALHHFAKALEHESEPVGRMEHLAIPFKRIAGTYLQWEEADLKRIIDRIDALDQREWATRYVSDPPVDWDGIEQETNGRNIDDLLG